MKLLVYTCVFDRYDQVFPPVEAEDGLSYVIVTDDASMQVEGWETRIVPRDAFSSGTFANRYYKMLSHREFQGFDHSLYVDGNVRLLGRTSEFFEAFVASNAALGLFPHPLRASIADEALACIAAGKVSDRDRLDGEMAFYRQDGFADDVGLIEATILLKNHSDPALGPAMDLWWELFGKFGTRDQVSLPYVLWKTGVSRMLHDWSFREPNPYFALYPHCRAQGVNPRYARVSARSHDSLLNRCLLSLWHLNWKLRRTLRRIRNGLANNA